MPGGQLPEGLVTANNETVGEEIANIDRIDLEDVARLWRGMQSSRSTPTPWAVHKRPDMIHFSHVQ